MSLGSLLRSQQRGEILLPVLKKYLLEEDEAVRTGKLTRAQIDASDAEMTIRCFKERKKIKEAAHHPEGEFFHPSSLGQCIRRLFFAAKNAPPNDGGEKGADHLLRWHMILETGTYFHVMIQNLCEKAGVLVHREIPIINEQHKIIGTGDGVLKIKDGELLEIKTINSRDFAGLSQPQLGHRMQTHAYMKCLKLNKAVVLYCDKGSSALKEFIIPFDEKFYIKQVRDRIDWHFDNVRTNTLPIREGVNPRMMPCLYCEFTHVCYDSERLKNFMNKLKSPMRKLKIKGFTLGKKSSGKRVKVKGFQLKLVRR